MALFIDFFLFLLTSLLAIPVVVFFVEILAAILLRFGNRTSEPEADFGRIAVLVPAHNESVGLKQTIADIKAQLREADRLIVIADNCSDDTAAVATAAGAEVIERNDVFRIGKGYALDWGIRHLRTDAPSIVIFIDADCRVAASTINRLGTVCAASARPVQGLDLMIAPENSPTDFRVAEFTWRLKNWVRPLGLSALGLPCQLMGTGMAVPWNAISAVNLASPEIVEDLKLGLDLASAGSPPIFCPTALVTSQFPSSNAAAAAQRQRWEHGHVRMILKTVPRFIWLALAQRNFPLLALSLDVTVPPLTLLGLMTIAAIAITGTAFSVGFSSLPLIVSSCSFAGFVIGVFLSWVRFGRDVLPANAFLSVARFILAKASLYYRIISRSAPMQWTRTDREK